MCVGGIYDWMLGNDTVAGLGKPSWVIGDTFLPAQRNVYSVYRQNPPSIGFAQLSDLAVSSSGQNTSSPAATATPQPTEGSLSSYTIIPFSSASLSLIFLFFAFIFVP
ncbi:hypothetical protein B0H19DRAFT_1256497 [Mycena capillaripes]|nr:hypothetical protein B0H19DRAFT_1256497 [Mycena capillaripes]